LFLFSLGVSLGSGVFLLSIRLFSAPFQTVCLRLHFFPHTLSFSPKKLPWVSFPWSFVRAVSPTKFTLAFAAFSSSWSCGSFFFERFFVRRPVADSRPLALCSAPYVFGRFQKSPLFLPYVRCASPCVPSRRVFSFLLFPHHRQ